jgi:dTDP-4-dehydrorhamnose 3,5-epimerase-like enzyme
VFLSPMCTNKIMIPPRHWHGFQALDEDTVILYYTTVRYNVDNPDESRKQWDYLGKDVWDIEFR